MLFTKMPWLMAICALCMTPALSWAQSPAQGCLDYLPPDAARDARLLAMRGVACFEAKEYARALSFYQRAQRVNRDPLLDAAIGRTWDELGGLDQARTYYRRYLRVAPEQDVEGRMRIEERLRALESEIRGDAPRVNVEVWPTSAEVWMVLPGAQRELLGETPLQIRLRPGSYTLYVEQRGYHGRRHALELKAGEVETVEGELVSQDALFNVEAQSWKRVGLWTMAAGAPLVIGGTVLTILGNQRLDQAKDELHDETPERRRELLDSGYSRRGWGLGLLFVGGATVITGSAFWLTGKLSEDEPNQPASTSGVTPQIGPGWAGVRVDF